MEPMVKLELVNETEQPIESKPKPLTAKERALSALGHLLGDFRNSALVELRIDLSRGFVHRGGWTQKVGYGLDEKGCVLAYKDAEGADHHVSVKGDFSGAVDPGVFYGAWDAGTLTEDEVLDVVQTEIDIRGID